MAGECVCVCACKYVDRETKLLSQASDDAW